jgi:hypothetical protein
MYRNTEVVIKNYSGLSTETKPTAAGGSVIPNGSRWREVDTGSIYHYDAVTDGWYLSSTMSQIINDGTQTADIVGQELLGKILMELKKINLHLAMMTDNAIENMEVE